MEIGEKVGRACRGGEILSLSGPLGAGKSVLTKGIAKGLGITGPVRSPSFNLMREYHGRLILRHWDLFRLESGFESLGLLESADDESVVVVEWAEKWITLNKCSTNILYIGYGLEESERTIKYEGNVPGLNCDCIEN
jgi:tRNA threonylcarbamoyl adenosine modification protein YjeE